MVSCVLFVQMGLGEAIRETLHIRLRIASCPKCLTWWICLAYLVAHDYGIIISVAASFILAYAAMWLALALDTLSVVYNKAYEKITQNPGAEEGADTEDTAGSDPDGLQADSFDEVPQMRIKT